MLNLNKREFVAIDDLNNNIVLIRVFYLWQYIFPSLSNIELKFFCWKLSYKHGWLVLWLQDKKRSCRYVNYYFEEVELLIKPKLVAIRQC